MLSLRRKGATLKTAVTWVPLSGSFVFGNIADLATRVGYPLLGGKLAYRGQEKTYDAPV